jgi:hypothetical protein
MSNAEELRLQLRPGLRLHLRLSHGQLRIRHGVDLQLHFDLGLRLHLYLYLYLNLIIKRQNFLIFFGIIILVWPSVTNYVNVQHIPSPLYIYQIPLPFAPITTGIVQSSHPKPIPNETKLKTSVAKERAMRRLVTHGTDSSERKKKQIRFFFDCKTNPIRPWKKEKTGENLNRSD